MGDIGSSNEIVYSAGNLQLAQRLPSAIRLAWLDLCQYQLGDCGRDKIASNTAFFDASHLMNPFSAELPFHNYL